MVRDVKRVTVQDQIDVRVRVNCCRDPMVVIGPPLFVQMTCMRDFRLSCWSRLYLEYPEDFSDVVFV